MTELEPTLSSACCACPVPYRLVGQFLVIGRIKDQNFNVPIEADTACPTQLTLTGHCCSHQTGHPSHEFQFHVSSDPTQSLWMCNILQNM